jgi:hypothetical protein
MNNGMKAAITALAIAPRRMNSSVVEARRINVSTRLGYMTAKRWATEPPIECPASARARCPAVEQAGQVLRLSRHG